jgi:ribonuclease P protein component
MGRQRNTFGKGERLKSVIVFDRAFSEGSKLKAFPLLVRYTNSSFDEKVPYQVATTVSKRRFKRAVDRNRIKRLLREAWRLEKHRLLIDWTPGDPQRAIVFIYVGSTSPTFEQCQSNIRKIVSVLIDAPITKPTK